MWIRTQTRYNLINLDNLIGLNVRNKEEGDYYEIMVEVESGEGDIGTYRTEKRALEVMDEIQVAIIGKVFVPKDYFPQPKYENEITPDYLGIETLPIVYDMPAD